MADKSCTCPVVEITVTNYKHVSQGQLEEIANMLNASISLRDDVGLRTMMSGPHRDDCLCAPVVSPTGELRTVKEK